MLVLKCRFLSCCVFCSLAVQFLFLSLLLSVICSWVFVCALPYFCLKCFLLYFVVLAPCTYDSCSLKSDTSKYTYTKDSVRCVRTGAVHYIFQGTVVSNQTELLHNLCEIEVYFFPLSFSVRALTPVATPTPVHFVQVQSWKILTSKLFGAQL